MRIFLALSLVAFSFLWTSPLRAEETVPKNFTYIRQEDLDKIENLHQHAEKLIQQKDFRAAIDVYSEILLIEPDDDDAYANMGQAYMVVGDFQRAKNSFRNALDINPGNQAAMLCLKRIADPDFSPTVEQTQEAPMEVARPTALAPTQVATPIPPPKSPSEITADDILHYLDRHPKPAAPAPAPKPVMAVEKPRPVAPAVPVAVAVPAKIVAMPPKPAPVVPAPVPAIAPVSAVPVPSRKLEIKIPEPQPASTKTDFVLHSDWSFNQWSQLALKNLGLYDGPIDGKMSEVMRKAIQTFQRQNEIEPDGMVGPDTWAKLKLHLDKNLPPQKP